MNLIEATTDELIQELASRNEAHVIAVKVNGHEEEFVTKLGTGDILGTIGLHRILKERIDIYLHDTTREGYEDQTGGGE